MLQRVNDAGPGFGLRAIPDHVVPGSSIYIKDLSILPRIDRLRSGPCHGRQMGREKNSQQKGEQSLSHGVFQKMSHWEPYADGFESATDAPSKNQAENSVCNVFDLIEFTAGFQAILWFYPIWLLFFPIRNWASYAFFHLFSGIGCFISLALLRESTDR